MPDSGAPEEWDGARYQREKRNFIEQRRLLRPLAVHAGVIFALTGLAGWLASRALLAAGVHNLPVRYAASFLVAYLAFALCVRGWSSLMRRERGSTEGSWDFPQVVDGEGCLVMLAMLAVGMVLALVFSLLGGIPLLLEVAFEVVFAGVVVRRLGRRETVGDWSGTLLRNTWLPALAIALVMVTLAGWLQHEAPAARTLGEAVRSVWGKPGAHSPRSTPGSAP